ncbi:unnamed protein product, partial [Phaeothamnion confervicola]
MRTSANGSLATTLKVEPMLFRVGPFEFHTRAYEGSIPGPTLVLQPGDALSIRLENLLGDDASSHEAAAENSLRHPNETNLHTHGLHVSPSGNADNVYRVAKPGTTLQYDYVLPADHYRGVFYYHPHHSGSSTLQMLGGMAGAIVVADDWSTTPWEVEAATDVVMHFPSKAFSLKTFSFRALQKDMFYRRRTHQDYALLETRKPGAFPLHFFVANGQFQPILSAAAGEVVRLRVVHAGASASLSL